MKVPGLGVGTTAAGYTTAHGNARSLTHRGRPGMEPATPCLLVGFVSAAPRQKLPVPAYEYENKVLVR